MSKEIREIKFRSWDGKKYHYHNHLSGLYGIIVVESQQFTGLKDKQGNEIYEGDITAYRERKYLIVWEDKSASFWADLIAQGKDESYRLGQHFECGVYAEIIGNKYQNPELLALDSDSKQ